MTSTHGSAPEARQGHEGTVTHLADLHDDLDSLWASYLLHLDAYTGAQKTLQKHMSAGFLSLARANYNASHSIRRYGKDYYHEKAVASRRIRIGSQRDNSTYHLEVVRWPTALETKDHEDRKMTRSQADAALKETTQQPSPPATPTPDEDRNKPESPTHPDPGESPSDTEDSTTLPNSAESSAKIPPQKKPLESDPLRWFGVIVPRDLRLAQSEFDKAMGETIAVAVNSARSMREIEVEMRKLRKEIRRMEKTAPI